MENYLNCGENEETETNRPPTEPADDWETTPRHREQIPMFRLTDNRQPIDRYLGD